MSHRDRRNSSPSVIVDLNDELDTADRHERAAAADQVMGIPQVSPTPCTHETMELQTASHMPGDPSPYLRSPRSSSSHSSRSPLSPHNLDRPRAVPTTRSRLESVASEQQDAARALAARRRRVARSTNSPTGAWRTLMYCEDVERATDDFEEDERRRANAEHREQWAYPDGPARCEARRLADEADAVLASQISRIRMLAEEPLPRPPSPPLPTPLPTPRAHAEARTSPNLEEASRHGLLHASCSTDPRHNAGAMDVATEPRRVDHRVAALRAEARLCEGRLEELREAKSLAAAATDKASARLDAAVGMAVGRMRSPLSLEGGGGGWWKTAFRDEQVARPTPRSPTERYTPPRARRGTREMGRFGV